MVDGRAALRRSRSHDLVAVQGCLVAHPLIAELLEGDRYHGASEVMLRCGARTGDRLAATRPASVAAQLPADVSRRSFTEEAAGRRWRVSARSFFQARPDGADALAEILTAAAKEVGSAGRAVDLYSGVGLFAGCLADQGWSVTAVEGATSSVADARHNLRGTGTEVVHADVTRWPGRQADLVVADPSRAGLGKAGVAAIAGCRPRRVVLVSCDVASLGRDAGLLTAAGYRMVWWQLVDLFPHTHHVEVVSAFDYAEPQA